MLSMGGVAGESDIAILLKRGEFGSFIMEYKAEEGTHKTSDDQLDYLKAHNGTGNCAVVAKGVYIAKAAISQYMAL
jgi:hypothetical protein